jgi:hypothetical protein
VLEQEVVQSRQELTVRDLQLEKLTSALSNQARVKTSAIEANARLLLENYGGFLSWQDHIYAEQLKEASSQMERLRQDLVGGQAPTAMRRQLSNLHAGPLAAPKFLTDAVKKRCLLSPYQEMRVLVW